ncbi:MAG: oligosaccharide flippase family protein [Saprospiraceae bacterium]|nr:oligosaccharide flippase family protein [Saprospiraceae bacterium]
MKETPGSSPPNQWLERLWSARLTFFNFFSLGLLKATDALILLFLIPIIISRVGIAYFGVIAFVGVWLNYGRAVVDYGFNISGVRQIALIGEDRQALSHLFFQVLYSKTVIALFFAGALLILVQVVPFLGEKKAVFQWGLWMIAGQVFFTDWFFIGLQKSYLLAIANLLIKSLYAVLIFWGIQGEADYIYVLAYQGLAATAVGALVIVYIVIRFKLSIKAPSWQAILGHLKTDFKLLGSNLAVEFNSSYSLLVLNVIWGDILTGYFNVMYRLLQPIRFLLIIFSQTIFPIVCEKTKEGWLALKQYLRNAFLLFVGAPILAVVLLAFCAEPIFLYFAGDVNEDLLYSLRLYLIVPLVTLLNIPAYQILLAYDLKTAYVTVLLSGLAVNLILAYFLTEAFQLNGLICSLLIVEAWVSIGLYIMLNKHRNLITQHG